MDNAQLVNDINRIKQNIMDLQKKIYDIDKKIKGIDDQIKNINIDQIVFDRLTSDNNLADKLKHLN